MCIVLQVSIKALTFQFGVQTPLYMYNKIWEYKELIFRFVHGEIYNMETWVEFPHDQLSCLDFRHHTNNLDFKNKIFGKLRTMLV